MSPFLVLALALLGTALAAQAPGPTTTLAAQRVLALDGAVTATMFAGHKRASLQLLVAWSPLDPRAGTIILPANHSLLQYDVASGWYDGQSVATLEQLQFLSRDQTRRWHVSAGPPTMPAPVLNLGPPSPVWLQHDAVAFTGSQLHFFQRQLGRPRSAIEALREVAGQSPQSARHLTLWFGSPIVHNLTVVDPVTGTLLGRWPVLIDANPDATQTLVPATALAKLREGLDNLLLLDGRVLIGRNADVDANRLLAPMPEGRHPLGNKKREAESVPKGWVPPTPMLVGRRLLQQVGVAWAVDAQGHVAASLVSTSTEGDAVPQGVYWVAFLAGAVLMWFTAYWTSSLALTLELRYEPSPREGVVVTRRDIGFGYAVLLLSVLTHVLMAVYAGRDPLIDASLEEPLGRFVLFFGVGSALVGAVYAAVLIFETVRELRWPAYRLVPVQLYAVLQGAVTARGVLAALLTSAGTALPLLAVTNFACLAFVFFPALYGALILLTHVLAGVRLYLPPPAPLGQTRLSVLFTLLCLVVVLALSVAIAVTQPLYLLGPWLNVLNAYYPPDLVAATVWVAMTIPLAAAAFSVHESGKGLLDKAIGAR